MSSMCDECKNNPCDKPEKGGTFGCINWIPNLEKVVPLEPVTDERSD